MGDNEGYECSNPLWRLDATLVRQGEVIYVLMRARKCSLMSFIYRFLVASLFLYNRWFIEYRKVASRSTSLLVPQPRFFRLEWKILYLCTQISTATFSQWGLKLNSSQYGQYLRQYGTVITKFPLAYILSIRTSNDTCLLRGRSVAQLSKIITNIA